MQVRGVSCYHTKCAECRQTRFCDRAITNEVVRFSYGQANGLSVTFRAGTEISVVRKEQLGCRRSTPEALEVALWEPLRFDRASRQQESRDTQLPPARDLQL